MRSVAQIIPNMRNMPLADGAPKQVDEDTAKVINRLFRELKAIFPAWKQAWPAESDTDAAKASWTKAFIAQSISQIEQIRYGIEACRRLNTPFIPSVGEFIAMCQPTAESLGLPPAVKAFEEAVRNAHPSMGGAGTWTHPAVYHAASEAGFYNLNTLSTEAARKLFERNYQITVRAVIAGEPLRGIAVGIGHDGQKTQMERAEEIARQRQAHLMELQAVPSSAAACRTQLLRKFNISRQPQHVEGSI